MTLVSTAAVAVEAMIEGGGGCEVMGCEVWEVERSRQRNETFSGTTAKVRDMTRNLVVQKIAGHPILSFLHHKPSTHTSPSLSPPGLSGRTCQGPPAMRGGTGVVDGETNGPVRAQNDTACSSKKLHRTSMAPTSSMQAPWSARRSPTAGFCWKLDR